MQTLILATLPAHTGQWMAQMIIATASRYASSTMRSIRTFAVAIIALPTMLASVSASAQPNLPAIGSEAYGISAVFTSQAMTTSLGPVDDLQPAFPPAYSKTKVLGSYDNSIAVPPLVPSAAIEPMVASFTAQAKTLSSHVASRGIQLDSVSTTGDSKIASANLQIVGPISDTLVELFLSVDATDVTDSASYSKVFPNFVTVTGSASFGSLTIGGSLVGGHTIKYSGSAPPNTVLYQTPTTTSDQSPAVIITINQQRKVGLISCSPKCQFTPDSLIVHALDISLNNALILGHPVTGDIVLGGAAAQ
jgi:hypothetical protein